MHPHRKSYKKKANLNRFSSKKYKNPDTQTEDLPDQETTPETISEIIQAWGNDEFSYWGLTKLAGAWITGVTAAVMMIQVIASFRTLAFGFDNFINNDASPLVSNDALSVIFLIEARNETAALLSENKESKQKPPRKKINLFTQALSATGILGGLLSSPLWKQYALLKMTGVAGLNLGTNLGSLFLFAAMEFREGWHNYQQAKKAEHKTDPYFLLANRLDSYRSNVIKSKHPTKHPVKIRLLREMAALIAYINEKKLAASDPALLEKFSCAKKFTKKITHKLNSESNIKIVENLINKQKTKQNFYKRKALGNSIMATNLMTSAIGILVSSACPPLAIALAAVAAITTVYIGYEYYQKRKIKRSRLQQKHAIYQKIANELARKKNLKITEKLEKIRSIKEDLKDLKNYASPGFMAKRKKKQEFEQKLKTANRQLHQLITAHIVREELKLKPIDKPKHFASETSQEEIVRDFCEKQSLVFHPSAKKSASESIFSEATVAAVPAA